MESNISSKAAAFWFWSVVGFFAVLWVMLPTLFHSGYRPDVLELQLVAKEWVLATRKHPMLPAWILEILNMITNRAFAAPFIASQLCMLLTLWSVWQFGRKVLSEKLALIGTFAMLPYWFFTVESVKFNQNIALIAFWSLSIYLVFQALQTNRIPYWIAAGVSIGLAFHAKYAAVFLVCAILVYMIVRGEGRKYWKTIGPYLTTLTAFLVFLPHLIWLYQDNFALLTYVHDRPLWSAALSNRVFLPLRFVGGSIIYVILPLFVLVPAIGCVWNWRLKTRAEDDDGKDGEKFLFYCLMIPLGIHLLISGLMHTKLTSDYACAFWAFLGVWLLLRFRAREKESDSFNVFCRTLKFLAAAEFVLVALFFTQLLSPHWSGRANRFQFPMREFGTECNQIWDSRFQTSCPYLSGDWILAGNAAYIMKDRPSVIFYWDTDAIYNKNARPAATWAEDSDLNEKGGLLLWERSGEEVPDWLYFRYPKAEVLSETLVLSYVTGAKIQQLRVGTAIVPPPKK